MVERVDINRLLVEMRALKSQSFPHPELNAPRHIAESGALRPLDGSPDSRAVPSFSELMSQAVDKVNNTQKAASDLKSAYERGLPGVDITDVMVATQKASVSFQAALQVRNKVVEAYRDVMNMPV